MNENHIKLQTSSILKVPLKLYNSDFKFIVNGKEFKTSRIVADLISPRICRIHSSDPTINKFSINTSYQGDFSYILNLVNFEKNDIPEKEMPFIAEVISALDNESIEIQKKADINITNENIFELIAIHERSGFFYSDLLQKEIDYISSHFFEMEEKSDEFYKLSLDTIERILKNPCLQLESEDQLLSFINHLYLKDSYNSYLYEFVEFSNISQNKITEFLYIFDYNDITHNIWKMLSSRLEQQIIQPDKLEIKQSRYHSKTKINKNKNNKSDKRISLLFEQNKEFQGVINYLSTQSRGDIFSKINISSSSVANENDSFSPINSILYEDETRYFLSSSTKNAWICFDFKKHSIIPTNYTIRSFNELKNEGAHPKSWVIEGSNDNENWIILDSQKNCSLLNGMNLIHTFPINNPDEKDFRFIRMRQTAHNWIFSYCLCIDSIEFYGILI